YWGSAGAPADNADFSSLSAAQKKVVARALGYEVFEGTSFYKATEPVATRMVQGFHDGNKVDYSLIDWGGVGAPDSATASFEELSIEQRDFVASQKGYQRFNAQVFYKPGVAAPAKEIRTSFTVGTGSNFDVDYDQVEWGTLAKPESSVLFADLRAEQQDVILAKLGYRRYDGLVWREGATANYRVTFVEAASVQSGGLADYTNANTPWTLVAVPSATTPWVTAGATPGLLAEQQARVLTQRAIDSYASTAYFKAVVPANQATIGLKPVMTTFEQGLHYQQSQVTFSTTASKDKRFVVSDGTNKYVVYAKDENNNGVFDSIEVQKPHELLGQRGYGFLLAGTLTTLGNNVGFNVSGKDDVIITGNINLNGQNSGLALQSDRWVYLEGAAKVSGDLLVRGGLRVDPANTAMTNPGVFPPAATQGAQAQPGANTRGVSVFVHPTAQLNTLGAGTRIALHGGQDVIVNGRVI
ncbi:MAG: hypothetical protein ACKO8O_18575, partial [Betaproteobacteria bacterium]